MADVSAGDDDEGLDFFSDSLSTLFDVHSPARGQPGSSLVYSHAGLLRAPNSEDQTASSSISFGIPDHDGVSTKLFAHYQWDAGWDLANEIVCCSTSRASPSPWADVRGKSCVEVGAGTGLPSLVAHRMGAASVTITDYPDEAILANLRSNISRQHASMHGCQTAVEGLSWGERDQEQRALSHSRNSAGFDLVIAADTLWVSSAHQLLLHTLLTLVERQHGRILLTAGFHSGVPCVRRFFELCEAGIDGLGRLIPDDTALPETGTASEGIAGIWEKNIPSGTVRKWDRQRQTLCDHVEGEDMGSIEERAKWCVTACLKWQSLSSK